MKSIILGLMALSLSTGTFTDEEVKDLEKLAQTIHQFSESVDTRNVKATDKVLHHGFRAVVNRLFGSEEVSIMDKTLYLNLLKEGKIGGDKRTVKIHSINMEGNNAVVKVEFDGSALRFQSFMQMVKDTAGNWTIISDMPNVEKK